MLFFLSTICWWSFLYRRVQRGQGWTDSQVSLSGIYSDIESSHIFMKARRNSSGREPKQAGPWSKCETRYMWKNAFFRPNLDLVTLPLITLTYFQNSCVSAVSSYLSAVSLFWWLSVLPVSQHSFREADSPKGANSCRPICLLEAQCLGVEQNGVCDVCHKALRALSSGSLRFSWLAHTCTLYNKGFFGTMS